MSVALEQQFTKTLLENLERASSELGVVQKRLAAQVAQFGGVSCAKELLRRGRLSDGFDDLARIGRLELSLEALLTDGKYGALFTDAETNQVFSALCDSGFYVWRRG